MSCFFIQCEVHTFKERINDTIQQIQLISFDKILNYFSHIEMHDTYILRTSHNEARCDVLWQQALIYAFREWCIPLGHSHKKLNVINEQMT